MEMTDEIYPLLCTYCLMVQDARVNFRAHFSNKTENGPAAGVSEIIRWYKTLDPVGLRFIDYAANRGVLIPVAIWRGTPICEPHIWNARQELDKELRRR